MTTIDALKELVCAIKNDGTTADQIGGDTVVELIKAVTRAHKAQNGSMGELTITSLPGSTLGTTKINVNGASDNPAYKYKAGGNVSSPNYYDDLNDWANWDGVGEITAEDGSTICVAEVDSDGYAIACGMTSVNANIG